MRYPKGVLLRSSDDSVPETRGLESDLMTHCNKHLQVKLVGQKGMLHDIPWLPMPLRWLKRFWRGRNDVEKRGFLFGWLVDLNCLVWFGLVGFIFSYFIFQGMLQE